MMKKKLSEAGFSIVGIIYLDKVRSEQTSQKELIPGSLNPFSIWFLIHIISSSSSFFPLTNCLLQMYCSKNS